MSRRTMSELGEEMQRFGKRCYAMAKNVYASIKVVMAFYTFDAPEESARTFPGYVVAFTSRRADLNR